MRPWTVDYTDGPSLDHEQRELLRAAYGFCRKHGEGFFRWVHLSCSHESHYKVSLQGIIIMKVIARSHCKEPLQGVMRVIASCKEPSAWSQAASASSQVQLTCEELKSLLRAGGSADGSTRKSTLCGLAWARCKNSSFFCDFVWARATLCGDRRGRRCKKLEVFPQTVCLH